MANTNIFPGRLYFLATIQLSTLQADQFKQPTQVTTHTHTHSNTCIDTHARRCSFTLTSGTAHKEHPSALNTHF